MSATLLTPRAAAERLGVSYPTLKHWILAGRIQTVKTPGGHHRISLEALEQLLPSESSRATRPASRRISGRNQLLGSVAEITADGIFAKIVVEVAGGQKITAVVTNEAVRDLDLKPGDPVFALIKSTDVMLALP